MVMFATGVSMRKLAIINEETKDIDKGMSASFLTPGKSSPK